MVVPQVEGDEPGTALPSGGGEYWQVLWVGLVLVSAQFNRFRIGNDLQAAIGDQLESWQGARYFFA